MPIYDNTDYIDQLAEWWENAEESDDFYPGDTWIKRRQAQTGGYVYDVGRVTSKKRYYEARVLARAPIPSAPYPAILATYHDENGMVSGVWTYDHPGYWEGPEGDIIAEEALEDVIPLIPAKVTDEMVNRAYGYAPGTLGSKDTTRRLLTAALDIEEKL